MSVKPSHYMQTTAWAHLRQENGWSVEQLNLDGKQLFIYAKKSPAGPLLYLPGYMPQNSKELDKLVSYLKLRSTRALVCKIEPCEEADPKIAELLMSKGWRKARNIQYSHTIRLDLAQSENELWMGMKARGRQEINYAKRDGVVVDQVEPNSENFEVMHRLLKGTSERKSFGIRDKESLLHFWSAFAGEGCLRMVFAKLKGKVIAGAVFITDGSHKVWYKDAGSDPKYNKHFGPRLLLWEIALQFKKDGYKTFDLGGIPDPNHHETSAMKGVYTFKTAFTREITNMMPAFELPLKPALYPVWKRIEPKALKARRFMSKVKSKVKN